MTASADTPSSPATGFEGHGKTQQDNFPRSIALPKDYSPRSFDVLCGRGRDYYQHVGNQRFRLIVSLSLERYSRATTKHDKGLIIISIVDTIRQASPHGGFIRFDRKSGNWYEIGDDAAREKVGQAIRDALVHKDPSKKAEKLVKRANNKAKRRARKIEAVAPQNIVPKLGSVLSTTAQPSPARQEHAAPSTTSLVQSIALQYGLLSHQATRSQPYSAF